MKSAFSKSKTSKMTIHGTQSQTGIHPPALSSHTIHQEEDLDDHLDFDHDDHDLVTAASATALETEIFAESPEDSNLDLSIREQIRNNLDRKRQSRPSVQVQVERPPKTANALQKINNPDIPRRKSLLEYAEGDLAKSGLKSLIYRFIAIGSHDEDPEEFMALHEKIIEAINTACYDEPATGYLIVFPKHFVHLIEASELTINKYIAVCAEIFQGVTQHHIETDYHHRGDKAYVARMVILNYIITKERYTTEWYHVVHLSPSHRGLMHHKGFRKRLFEFVKGIWVLAGVLADSYAKDTVVFSDDPAEASIELVQEKELYRQVQEKLFTLFPGTDILNYLLKEKKRVPPLRTPAEHIEKFWTVPNFILESEVTWPIPCRLAPYH